MSSSSSCKYGRRPYRCGRRRHLRLDFLVASRGIDLQKLDYKPTERDQS